VLKNLNYKMFAICENMNKYVVVTVKSMGCQMFGYKVIKYRSCRTQGRDEVDCIPGAPGTWDSVALSLQVRTELLSLVHPPSPPPLHSARPPPPPPPLLSTIRN